MPTMGPSQILDMRNDLLVRCESRTFHEAMGSMTFAEMRSGGASDERAREAVVWFGGLLKQATRLSEAYRVTPDMVDLMTYAAASLEEEDTWDRTLAPTSAGLVRFDKPVHLGTMEGKPYSAEWLLWGPAHKFGKDDGKPRTILYWIGDLDGPSGTTWASFLSDIEAHGDYMKAARAIQGRWVLVGWDLFVHGESLGASEVNPEDQEHLRMLKFQAVLGSESLKEIDGEQANSARLCHALWLLLNQTIVSVEEEKPDRAAGRRAIKKGFPPRVTTISLRRTESRPSEGESHVEWHHRWIVRGHWRWQACGPGRSERVRIWIAPFVKGPEDAPLKQSDKLYDLRK